MTELKNATCDEIRAEIKRREDVKKQHEDTAWQMANLMNLYAMGEIEKIEFRTIRRMVNTGRENYLINRTYIDEEGHIRVIIKHPKKFEVDSNGCRKEII